MPSIEEPVGVLAPYLGWMQTDGLIGGLFLFYK